MAVERSCVSRTEAKTWMRVDSTTDDDLISRLLRRADDYVERFTSRQILADTRTEYFDTFADPLILPRPPLKEIISVKYLDVNGTEQTLATSVYSRDKIAEPGCVRLAYGQSWPATRDVKNAVYVEYTCGYATPVTSSYVLNYLVAVGYPHLFAVDEQAYVYNSGGALPGGLVGYINYFIKSRATTNITLSATKGGTAIDTSDDGSGDHFLGLVPAGIRQAVIMLAAHWYEHREAYSESKVFQEVPMAVQNILWQYRVMTMV